VCCVAGSVYFRWLVGCLVSEEWDKDLQKHAADPVGVGNFSAQYPGSKTEDVVLDFSADSCVDYFTAMLHVPGFDGVFFRLSSSSQSACCIRMEQLD
jgi:hypothetical protein